MKQTTRNRLILSALCIIGICAAVTGFLAFRGDTISVRMVDGGTYRTVGRVSFRDGAAVISVRKHTEMRTETKADTVRQVPVEVKNHKVIIPAEKIVYLTVE